jgi:hypothetical protein
METDVYKISKKTKKKWENNIKEIKNYENK